MQSYSNPPILLTSQPGQAETKKIHREEREGFSSRKIFLSGVGATRPAEAKTSTVLTGRPYNL